MTKTVLVAGGSGWMGQKIAQALLDRGAKPRLMVRGGERRGRAGMLKGLVDQGAVTVEADVLDAKTLGPAVENVDIIISALQGAQEVIVDGQRALAEAARSAGVRRMFPSDFSVDFRTIDDDEHIFLGWRRQADRAIAEIGLPQTNTFNGAFTEMLRQPFLGLIDWRAPAVTYWGDADQAYDFTTTDDTARYVAAAALDDNAPDGAFQIAGDVASPRDLAEIVGRVIGTACGLHAIGSLADLNEEIARRQAASPGDATAFAALQYHRAMASGRGKIRAPMNDRYPAITATSIEAFLRTTHD